ncbi:probable LRR receptor-like serine/threonine-protein kinase At3g47570 [Rhodamnia argentea]|uniref:Probable LRR receptor-like serine/threonine-protein kinase At3g47570 n=1 Tax=Rhodamnia argentea TaxID=178133 RepID=A0ABM3GYN6_9MYRT|nr:probable LRR receptor-like serine/threonine-protein kinase At3g47570 [Rhodamnia argentea]
MAHSRLVCARLLCSRLLLAALLLSSFAVLVSATNDTDRLGLLAFKAEIASDPFGSLNSWNDSTDFCRWYGVTCSRRHHRVTVLDLNSQGLSGPISSNIGNLSFLRELWLQNNSFGPEIPSQIGRLRRLQLLDLSNNSLTGEIPRNISGCSILVILTLQFNQLVGGIPVELGSLSTLQWVSFSANQLTGGIPSSIGNLTSLRGIYWADNGLNGVIPESLGRLTKLHTLTLGVNELSGTIPPSVFNLSSLTTMDVQGNQIRGNLPEDIGFTLPNLQFLSISSNQFAGSIPPSISNSTNLGVLQLGDNELSGKVPSLANLRDLELVTLFYNYLGSEGSDADDLSFLCSLTNAANLTRLLAHHNRLGGTLPGCIGNFSATFELLTLFQNLISGEIPREIGNLVNLQVLQMQDNLLSGPIPSDLGNTSNLVILILSGNNLSGVIPSPLQNLQSLLYLYLYNNNFEGPIPSNLSEHQSLTYLGLSNNNLSGPVIFPVAGNLIYLNLSRNHLSGALPTEIGNLKHLDQLDVSGNILGGEIPSSLGNCDGLRVLRLQDNLFHGSIPQSISSLRSIEELDLSNNSFYGEIPNFLGAFQYLKMLNLSYNHLEGPVPTQGVFRNVSATFVAGNEKLCGGMPELELPECVSWKSKSRGRVHKLKLSIAVVFGLLGITLVVIFLYLYWLKRKRNEPNLSSSNDSFLNLSYGTLLKATDGFSSTNLIGAGSFGSVYKGLLQENGTVIAVKVLNLSQHGALKSFKAECEALKRVRHRNLPKVLTACSGTDYKGDEFKALVYEFMVNGSLEEWLHPNPAPNDADGHSKKLSLIQRIDIAIDVASALDYLHNQCESPIIHCDLKPSNVLVDGNMVGHVGDFGLAKIVLESTSDTKANMSSDGLRGTVGYAAPEYANGSQISREGDVYSYGVLLLEMFTRLSPTSDMFRNNLNLHNYVAEAVPQRVMEITDPVLLCEGESHNSSQNSLQERNLIVQECLETIHRVGLACSMEEPRERMSIDKVATHLHSIRRKLFASALLG